MKEYELVREIKNLCRNNQMRDISITEIETDDPVSYVRSLLKGSNIEITPEFHGENVTVHAVCDGLMQTFTFTRI